MNLGVSRISDPLYPNEGHQTRLPLSKKERAEVKAILFPIILDYVTQSIALNEREAALGRKYTALVQREAELAQQKASLTQQEASLTQQEASLTQHEASLTQLEAALVQRDAELDRRKEANDRKIVELDKGIAAAELKEMRADLEMFLPIFCYSKDDKVPVPADNEKIREMHNAFVGKDGITLVEIQTEEGIKRFPRLNNIEGVVKFFQANNNDATKRPIRMCDVRHFKTGIPNIAPLTEYLKEASCKVMAIAVYWTADIQANLDTIKEVRPKFKVDYYPKK